MQTKSKIILLFILFIGISVSFLTTCCMHRIPPVALTETRMWVIKRRIVLVLNSGKMIPDKLSALPILHPTYDNGIIDAWGNPIELRINSNGTATLFSSGPNGVLDSYPRNDDIYRTFSIVAHNDKKIDDLEGWIETK